MYTDLLHSLVKSQMVKYNVMTTHCIMLTLHAKGHVKIEINYTASLKSFPSMYLEKSTYTNFQIPLT